MKCQCPFTGGINEALLLRKHPKHEKGACTNEATVMSDEAVLKSKQRRAVTHQLRSVEHLSFCEGCFSAIS